MTTCPSGVDYMHLVDQARVRIEKTYRRPFADRLVRALLARDASLSRALSRWRSGWRGSARPLVPMLQALGRVGARLEAMLQLAPDSLPAKTEHASPA